MATVRFCGVCGAPRDASSVNFCRSCGAVFDESQVPSGSFPTVASPSRSSAAMRTDPATVNHAGLGRRFAAMLVDVIGLTVILFGLAVAVGIAYASATGVTPEEGGYYAGGLFVSLWVAAPFLYFPLLWWGRLGGGTLGMRALDMRIVEATSGEFIGLGTAVLRYLGLLVAVAPIFIGVLWIAFDPQRQGWHDKIAGTLVVRRT
jgi:uncharacterized RDD family membrane protein YckC